MKVIKEISKYSPGFLCDLNDRLAKDNPKLAKAEIKVLSYLFFGRKCPKPVIKQSLITITQAMNSVKGYRVDFVPVDAKTGKETGEKPNSKKWKGEDIAKDRFSYLMWFNIYTNLINGSN